VSVLKFSIEINANPQKVWDILWNDATYRIWTNAFTEGSYAVSDWQQGSEVLFLAQDKGGMYSIIEKMIPLKLMSFKHLGEIHGEKRVAMEWEDAHENYYLEATNSGTLLSVEVGATDEFYKFLTDAFPTALNSIKSLAEA
jgi:hypothetical protein